MFRTFFNSKHLFGEHLSSNNLGTERHAEVAEEGFGFGARLCGGDDGDGEAEHVFQVFIRSFGEDGVLFYADGDIPHIVDRLRREAAEVARARKRDMDELVEEVIHPRAAKRRLEPDGVAFADLERSDGEARGARRAHCKRRAKLTSMPLIPQVENSTDGRKKLAERG